MEIIKTPKDSLTTMHELVLPNDTNYLHNLMGGRVLHWMDICGAIAAQKHAQSHVVTASVDNVSFVKPVALGDFVQIEAIVTCAFTTSMEVRITVWGQNPSRERYKCNVAYFTFVAIDEEGKKKNVPQLQPETEKEKLRFKGALHRKQMRLILAGKMKPADASELKAIFEESTVDNR